MEFDSLAVGTGIGNSYSVYQPPQPAETQNTSGEQTSATEAQQQKPGPVKEAANAIAAANKEAEKEKNNKTLTISEEEIDKTIETANKKIKPLFLEFEHRIHEKTNTLMISVINTATHEVVREIPPEKTLDALAKMWELTGILVDHKG